MNSLYRTMFFVPGNAPGKIAKGEIYGADALIYDLEDAVSVNEKDACLQFSFHLSAGLPDWDPDQRPGYALL